MPPDTAPTAADLEESASPRLGEPRTPVLVTGAASGIGRASARALAAVGRPVVCWDRDAEGARAVAQGIADDFGVPTHGAGIDVTARGGLPAAVENARAVVGTLGGVVHSAGVSSPEPLGAMTEETWDRVLGVHVGAAAFVVQAAAPDLRSQPGSAVVLLGSVGSFVAWAAIANYVTAKAAVLGLTRSLALSLADRGVRVNAVCPGHIDTPMNPATAAQEAATPLGRVGDPMEVARVVRFLLSGEAAFVTGTSVVVDGGLIAQAP